MVRLLARGKKKSLSKLTGITMLDPAMVNHALLDEIKRFVEVITKSAFTFCEYDRYNTVKKVHVEKALRFSDKHMVLYNSGGELYIARRVLEQFIRDTSRQITREINNKQVTPKDEKDILFRKHSQQSIDLLQLAAEEYMISLLQQAKRVAEHDNRTSPTNEDMHLVISLNSASTCRRPL